MLSILRNQTYRKLFVAQMVALAGTGLATVALGLLAFDLAGGEAGLVLATALTIKMVAYVTIAPVAAAFAEQVDRRRLLIVLDLVRAGVALCLPFVSEVWQIYVLIFLLQSASAAFTPTFQATIPDVLPDEQDYTQALSLSRIAMDAESLASPTLAALLLLFLSFDHLFWGTSLGFGASALLVLAVSLPSVPISKRRGIYDRITRGTKLYFRTPRLRGLFAISFVISATGAMVIVNTVVVIKSNLMMTDSSVALALGAFGAGSMLAAFSLPRILTRYDDRKVMLAAAGTSILSLLATATIFGVYGLSYLVLLIGWFFLGIGYSGMLTPSGRLLTRSAHAEDRPAVFAAQFALSHACWLLLYPLAGALITFGSATVAMVSLASLAILGLGAALVVWPAQEAGPIEHDHPDLPKDHPHIASGHGVHKHLIVIDDMHPKML
ncbi:MFS transporter [Labrenzia sp. CE80]|uniref:MFS transporter n=1 Tax=Labrenzia sp. CE80 TaxID=1788986 RepID=UPI00129AB87D|nr:MFS transporter [Labrenzia sp. CE80]